MHRIVEHLIGRLVTDSKLRRRFEENPQALLAEMTGQGLDLTPVELEALAAMDPKALRAFAGSLDRRILKASLTGLPDGTDVAHQTKASPDKEKDMNTRTPSSTGSIARVVRGAALIAALLLAGSASAQAGDWKWSVTPYVWATDVGVDVTIRDQNVVSDTIKFQDLLNDLDWAAQLHVEAQHGAHGVMFDYFGVKLSDENSRFALPMPAGAEAALDSTIEMSIIELGGVFDLGGDRQGFELLYGTRILTDRATLDTEFDLGSAAWTRHDESSDTLADALFGVRYQKRLSRRWGCLVRTDASTGGTDLTWSAAAAAGYTLGESGRYMLTAGYRYMSIKYDVDEPVEATLTMSGAFTGLRVSF